jgi:hypothetical protein
VIVDLIDAETWVTMSADVKGDAYEGDRARVRDGLQAFGAELAFRGSSIKDNEFYECLVEHISPEGRAAPQSRSVGR